MTGADDGRRPARWGRVDHALPESEVADIAKLVAARFPAADLSPTPAVPWSEVELRRPRLNPPAALAPLCLVDDFSRLLHATGQSYTDLVRARRGDFGTPPDVVACPRDAAEVEAVLAWCAEAGAACVPFGGGTSVVGGVNAPAGDRPVVVLQLRQMDAVAEVDPVSRAARIQAGATGPRLEDQLKAHGLTLRFYPQSFEYSTLGGWIATRAGGHYATRLTHVDDLVEAVTAVTPTGRWTSARLPASGAGPSPDRLLLGSEGTLGVITEAWVRLQARPQHRASASVSFPSFAAGADAVRAVVQSGLDPAGCRLLDPQEAALSGAGDGRAAVLMLSFESAMHPVAALLTQAVALCRDAGGVPERRPQNGGAARRWRETFLRAPYLRDALLGMGLVTETFETAITWDRFDTLVDTVTTATDAAVREVCGDGTVLCRITHAYPDGAAPYFTVVAPGRGGSEDTQWAAIKAAASEAIASAGGTITHHHAVGRDHRRWYDRQRPEPFTRAVAAIKAELDPAGMLNPGVLLDAGGDYSAV